MSRASESKPSEVTMLEIDRDANGGTEGAGTVSAPSQSAWAALLPRAALGAAALIGLSIIGAFSMLAGLDGARANPSPPPTPSVASVSSTQAMSPSAAAAGPIGPPELQLSEGSAADAGTPSAVPDGCSGRMADGRVVLNRAGADDLVRIPGVGPKRAQAILALRERLKRLRRPTDLLRIRGIGPKSLRKMRPHFVLDVPTGSCEAPKPQPASQEAGKGEARAK